LERVSFQPFGDTAEAVAACTACIEGKATKSLTSFLKKATKTQSDTTLALADKNLAVALADSGNDFKVTHNKQTAEIFRGIRLHMDNYLCPDDDDEGAVKKEDLRAMQLGLSHSLGRYKLKFSADKVDTMVIQAVGLLDELDKEINTYAMRVKEWYGWHFPELQALAGDNIIYAKLVLKCGFRPNFKKHDLSVLFDDEAQETAIKQAAEISMGTEIAETDILHIQALAEQVLSLTEYRAQLFEYLKNRMNAIAPNLTILMGELVGARLISHAGSLMNLAKQPASTVQILGAEKALFRALKTKHDTPKYGLIYHASLVGQAAPKNKGKISRVLAAKASLAIRVDALSDDTADGVDTTIGFEGRAKVEARLRMLENGAPLVSGGGNLTSTKMARYDPVAAKTAATSTTYNESKDMVLDAEVDGGGGELTPKEKKKRKKEKKEKRKSRETSTSSDNEEDEEPAKKKKRRKSDVSSNDNDDSGDDDDEAAKKAKKQAKKEKKAKKEKRKSKE